MRYVPKDRPALRRIPIPADRRFKLKMVGYNPKTPNWRAVFLSYGLLFALFLFLLIVLFAIMPATLTLPGSPFASDGTLTTAGQIVYGVSAAGLGFLSRVGRGAYPYLDAA
ncbi:MAG: hypothetical protein U5L04_08615 [Trueperaceae bacterium]|nr:hypothetical protein [Trueperaceae bacterium]